MGGVTDSGLAAFQQVAEEFGVTLPPDAMAVASEPTSTPEPPPAWGGAPPPGDADAPPHPSDDVAVLPRPARRTSGMPSGDALPPRQASASTPVDWGAFWATDHTGEDWAVEPILPRGRSVATFSPAGTGKSLLSLDVAAGVATSQRTLDQPAGPALSVVYLDLEMTEGDLYERLTEMGYGPNDDLSNLHYYLLPDLPPLDRPEGGAQLRDIAEAHNADLVVIDTISRAFDGPENDADSFRAYHYHTGRLLKADGRTVWRLDHAGKELDRGQRGTSAKNDDVDVVWRLTVRDAKALQLKAMKRRMSWVPESVDLTRLDEPLRHERAQASWPAGTKDAAAVLDDVGVPLEHGRGLARRALNEAGKKMANDVLTAALRWRRQNSTQRQVDL